jgi:hypothetical protein
MKKLLLLVSVLVGCAYISHAIEVDLSILHNSLGKLGGLMPVKVVEVNSPKIELSKNYSIQCIRSEDIKKKISMDDKKQIEILHRREVSYVIC